MRLCATAMATASFASDRRRGPLSDPVGQSPLAIDDVADDERCIVKATRPDSLRSAQHASAEPQEQAG